jgi:hypothetical protein
MCSVLFASRVVYVYLLLLIILDSYHKYRENYKCAEEQSIEGKQATCTFVNRTFCHFGITEIGEKLL